MSFAHPGLLGLVVLAVPALAIFLLWAWRSRVRAIDAFLPPALRSELDIQSSGSQALLRGALLVFTIVSLLLALARPRYGLGTTEVNQRGLDILVGIDTSRSMLAEDTGPGLSRLQRAKLAALDLARAAKRDRVGLIAFAGTAFLQCPLTVDDEAFRQSVESLDTTTIPQGGTALGAAIETALDAFRSEPDGVRTLVLFTDGEEHEAGALDAAKRAEAKGLRVYTIGVGTARGEVIRLRDDKGVESFLKDEQGNVVKSSLNEALLQEVAKTTGGLYLPLQGARAMQELYTQGLQPLPRAEFSSKSIQQYRERFQWPLGFALALLLAEYLLPERRSRRRGKRPSATTATSTPAPAPIPRASPPPPPLVAPAMATPAPRAQPHLDAVAGWVLTALLLGLGAVNAAASPRSAYRQFEKGDYGSAEEEYARLAEQHPDDPRLTFNAGLAAYRAKEFSKAAGHFGEALKAPDLRVQHDAYFNLGNARYFEGTGENDPAARSKLWEQALQNYESALRLAPQDTNAVNNREFVRRQLEELRRQQPPPQKSGDQKQDSQKDSKDSQDEQKQDSSSSADQKPKPDQDSKQDSQQQPSSKQDSPPDSKSDPQQDQASGQDSKDSPYPDTKDSKPRPKPGEDSPDSKDGKEAGKKDSPPSDSPSSRSAAGQKKPDGKDAGTEGTAGEAGAEEETPLGQMSSKQALRLLDTAKGEEKLMPLEKRRARPRGFKDW